MQSIAAEAFMGCENLTAISIPESVTYFGANAFSETPWLQAQQKENPLVIVNHVLIEGRTSTGEVTIPDGVTGIAPYAFAGDDELTDVTIPEGVTSIGKWAFSDCRNLNSITIPASVNEIGIMCFMYTSTTVYGYKSSFAETFVEKQYGTTLSFIPLDDALPAGKSGDINGDGALSVSDAVWLCRFIAEDPAIDSLTLELLHPAEGDTDGDGMLTVLDVAVILRKLIV